jgi:hypothetical protein
MKTVFFGVHEAPEIGFASGAKGTAFDQETQNVPDILTRHAKREDIGHISATWRS